MVSSSALLGAIAPLVVGAAAATYKLQDDYSSGGFYNNFDFITGADPTHGNVTYVSQSSAQSQGLLRSGQGLASWGVDSTTPNTVSRASVRLQSKKTYSSGLFVLDVAHMPEGCATWPAFWTTKGSDWPNQGEIDIIEGVNDQVGNQMTLHSGAACSISGPTQGMTGSIVNSDCQVTNGNNSGCGIKDSTSNSFGAAMNQAGGGVVVLEWTSSAISGWWFARTKVPADLSSGSPNPAGWGPPVASFEPSCSIGSAFTDHNIIFDTTLCGDWAGNTWDSSTCKSKAATCEDFVRNNPSAFASAYWTVNGLKVYSVSGAATPSPSPSPTSPAYGAASTHAAAASSSSSSTSTRASTHAAAASSSSSSTSTRASAQSVSGAAASSSTSASKSLGGFTYATHPARTESATTSATAAAAAAAAETTVHVTVTASTTVAARAPTAAARRHWPALRRHVRDFVGSS